MKIENVYMFHIIVDKRDNIPVLMHKKTLNLIGSTFFIY